MIWAVELDGYGSDRERAAPALITTLEVGREHAWANAGEHDVHAQRLITCGAFNLLHEDMHDTYACKPTGAANWIVK